MCVLCVPLCECVSVCVFLCAYVCGNAYVCVFLSPRVCDRVRQRMGVRRALLLHMCVGVTLRAPTPHSRGCACPRGAACAASRPRHSRAQPPSRAPRVVSGRGPPPLQWGEGGGVPCGVCFVRMCVCVSCVCVYVCVFRV